LATALATLLTLAASLSAQASTCDDFKAKLAARIESSGVRGYSLETVPARTAVPSGAKVIGTCETGAKKILYRRWGATQAASGAASAARTAPALQAPAVIDAPAQQIAAVRQERAPLAPPAVASGLTSPPMAHSKAAASQPIVAPALNTDDAAALRPVVGTTVALPTPVKTATTTADALPPPANPTPQAADIVAAYWPWIGALVLLVALLGWLWRARYAAYDKDGLPRGPRL
jgi:Protein of unknown function (DUF1161)